MKSAPSHQQSCSQSWEPPSGLRASAAAGHLQHKAKRERHQANNADSCWSQNPVWRNSRNTSLTVKHTSGGVMMWAPEPLCYLVLLSSADWVFLSHDRKSSCVSVCSLLLLLWYTRRSRACCSSSWSFCHPAWWHHHVPPPVAAGRRPQLPAAWRFAAVDSDSRRLFSDETLLISI